jgi:hypothetical protein
MTLKTLTKNKINIEMNKLIEVTENINIEDTKT